ncbi:hypothetical protein [Xanthobacter sediminis]
MKYSIVVTYNDNEEIEGVYVLFCGVCIHNCASVEAASRFIEWHKKVGAEIYYRIILILDDFASTTEWREYQCASEVAVYFGELCRGFEGAQPESNLGAQFGSGG